MSHKIIDKRVTDEPLPMGILPQNQWYIDNEGDLSVNDYAKDWRVSLTGDGRVCVFDNLLMSDTYRGLKPVKLTITVEDMDVGGTP